MILVSGAAGKTGRAVIRALINRQPSVRGLVRRAQQTAQLQSIGVQDIVVGDLQDRSSVAAAVQGVEAIYHICPNVHPDEIAIGEILLHAAQAAGVERFVYHSVLHPQTEAMPHHWQKLRVEERLLESGLTYTILQPAPYMQNILAQWDQIVKQGVYRVPYGAASRLSLVDLRDVAEAAAIVLTGPGHASATYELSGPEALSQTEVATILAEQLGRTVHVEVTPLDRWEQQAQSNQMGTYQIETLLKMFRYYDRYGLQGNSNVLEWLLDRPATRFADFVKRTLHDNAAE